MAQTAPGVATIGLDLRPTVAGFKAHFGRGTGRYAAELISQLTGNPRFVDLPTIRFRPVSPEDLAGGPVARMVTRMVPWGRETVATQCVLPRRLARLGLDACHFFSHGDAPAQSPTPCFVTVLDLIPLRLPALYMAGKPTWRFQLARSLEERAVRSASGIIAISEATRRDVVELLGVPPERVAVTPLAVGEAFRPVTPPEREAERRRIAGRLGFAPGSPLLLYVGGIDERKNVPFLLRVFAGLVREAAGEKPVLLLAGAYERDVHFPALRAQVRELGLEGRVLLTGFVPDADLPAHYRAADLFIFPSLYEGFGLPVLEALSCGTPVVAGNNSSIPEVAGNAAALLPDNDQDAWVREIAGLLASPERRTGLGAAGLARAAGFSWERTAELTVAAYRSFLPRQTAAPFPLAPPSSRC